MTRKATHKKRLDLWLNEADFHLLEEMADTWEVSRQRVIESALTYALARDVIARDNNGNDYRRNQRVPLNLDGLSLRQVEELSADAKRSESIRAALRAFHGAFYSPPSHV